VSGNKLLAKLRRLFRRILAFLLAREDDEPFAEIDRLIREAETELERARDAVAKALVYEKDLEREMLAAVALVQEWDRRAEQALRDDRADDARHAVERKLAYEQAASGLKSELQKQSDAVAYMRSRVQALQTRVESAAHQRSILRARHQRHETEAQIRRIVSRDGAIRDLGAAVDRAGSHSLEREAVIEAARELEQSSLETQLARVQSEADVEAELVAIRARLAQDDS